MKLLHTHSYGEESYGLVYQNEEGHYEVWEVPQYGGEERYYNSYNDLDEAICVSESFI